MRAPVLLLLGFLALALLPASFAHAQETSATLRIGYLRDAPEGMPSEAQLEAMRADLLAREAFRIALAAEGYGALGLFPCDGGEDMQRRINAGEFDLAFVPAIVFARQDAGYSAILQSRRSGDLIPPRDGPVQRQGVVFVSRRHPLFGAPNGAALRESLSGKPFGVVSAQSASGFVLPLLTMQTAHGVRAQDMNLVWFHSSEEVVKGVVSGLADVGACDAGALERTLGTDAARAALVRVLYTTEPVPTDPVAVRRELRAERSELGRQLRYAIREFSLKGGFADLQYQPARDEEFSRLRPILAEFDRTMGALRP